MYILRGLYMYLLYKRSKHFELEERYFQIDTTGKIDNVMLLERVLLNTNADAQVGY